MMGYPMCFAVLRLIALFNCIPSDAADSVKIVTDFGNYKTYEIKSHVILHCNVSTDHSKEYRLEWSKDSQLIAAEDKHFKILQGENKLIIERSVEGDAGNYTCHIHDNPNVSSRVELVGKPVLKLQANTGVVEGEKLKIVCMVVGKPTPTVEWIIGNETFNASRDRVELSAGENGVSGGVLTIHDVLHSDVGNYTCRARNAATKYTSGIEATTLVRVKDKLAALWPFIGICLEAIVLSGIILLYEKKRKLKSNDNNDADNNSDHSK